MEVDPAPPCWERGVLPSAPPSALASDEGKMEVEMVCEPVSEVAEGIEE